MWHKRCVPISWKMQYAVPILKPYKDANSLDAYRPISLTSCFAKCFETMLKNRIEWFIENEMHIPDFQNGFQSLAALGIPGSVLCWIFNFLNERQVFLKIKNKLYGPRLTNKGTPQGSVLSPLIFILSLVEFMKQIPANAKYSFFADDLVIYLNCDDISQGETEMNDCLRVVSSILLNNLKLEVCKKAELGLNILKSLAGLKWGSDPKILKTIYIATIRSHFDYGCMLYADAANHLLRKLDVLQNKALRVITGAMMSSPINSLEVEAGIVPYLSEGVILLISSVFSNELVDALAKSTENVLSCDFKVPHSDLVVFLKQNMLKRWTISLESSRNVKGRWLASIAPIPSTKAWYEKPNVYMGRNFITTICRLRIGHCRFPAHLHRLKLSDSPCCIYCSSDICDLNHLFFVCPHFSLQRLLLIGLCQEIVNPMPDNLQDLLKHPKVYSFIFDFVENTTGKFVILLVADSENPEPASDVANKFPQGTWAEIQIMELLYKIADSEPKLFFIFPPVFLEESCSLSPASSRFSLSVTTIVKFHAIVFMVTSDSELVASSKPGYVTSADRENPK
ncbi:reverse transcriptase (RNA-dependent DNA polymerase) domain-containing protein [Phthorimaea operculella]|nr:reverse transcriptase (RNA-dependent DNA polymerase) domain-containing protein [Phthorimaea operculella]